MPVMNINLFSITLRYGIDCMVVLPENLKKGEKLKCLWLYHGGSGDHTAWLYHTPLVELAEEKHFAAVLPNVHESCFVNMNIGDAFGTFVGKELPSVIWNMFKRRIRLSAYGAIISTKICGCRCIFGRR